MIGKKTEPFATRFKKKHDAKKDILGICLYLGHRNCWLYIEKMGELVRQFLIMFASLVCLSFLFHVCTFESGNYEMHNSIEYEMDLKT